MTIIIIKIVLVVLLLRVIALTVGHLIVVFCKDATKIAVNEIIKDPEDFVRSEHMCKFMYNMIWILLFIKLLYGAFTGHITINT